MSRYIFIPVFVWKVVGLGNNIPLFTPTLFYYFPQYSLPHGLSRVDLNSNVFILFHNSKYPEIRQGKLKQAPLVCIMPAHWKNSPRLE